MFSIDVVVSAPDDPSLQNVFHIQKYGMQLSPAGPIFFGKIYIYTLGVYVQFFKILAKTQKSPILFMYLLIVGSHYCVVRFAYALYMRQQNLVSFPC